MKKWPARRLSPFLRRYRAKQEEMSFEGPPRGRFEKTHETMYRGENLDQPTFRRRGLKIRVKFRSTIRAPSLSALRTIPLVPKFLHLGTPPVPREIPFRAD